MNSIEIQTSIQVENGKTESSFPINSFTSIGVYEKISNTSNHFVVVIDSPNQDKKVALVIYKNIDECSKERSKVSLDSIYVGDLDKFFGGRYRKLSNKEALNVKFKNKEFSEWKSIQKIKLGGDVYHILHNFFNYTCTRLGSYKR